MVEHRWIVHIAAVLALGAAQATLVAQGDVRVLVRAQADDDRFLDPSLEDSARDLERALQSHFREFRPLRVVQGVKENERIDDIADIEIQVVARFMGDGGDATILTHRVPGTDITVGTLSGSQRVVVAVLRVLRLEEPYTLKIVGVHEAVWSAAADDLSRQIQRWLQLNHNRLQRPGR